MKQIQRYGAYGLYIDKGHILLTVKKKGPYTGLLDLPGGGIEWWETPEEALVREFKEEIALHIQQSHLLTVATYRGSYSPPEGEEQYLFHHIAICYHVEEVSELSDCIPEEEFVWLPLKTIQESAITPIVQQATNAFLKYSHGLSQAFHGIRKRI